MTVRPKGERNAWRSGVREIVARSRQRVARLSGGRRADRIVFTFNGTDSLNLALHGMLPPGRSRRHFDHRAQLGAPTATRHCRTRGERHYVPADQDGRVRPDDVRKRRCEKTLDWSRSSTPPT